MALDTTPLLGTRSGVAEVVASTVSALSEVVNGPELVPYTVSARDTSGAGLGAVTLRWPARLLIPWWSRMPFPRLERWTGTVDVVHGTNYVVPATRAAKVVSVYDLSFRHDPDDAVSAARWFPATVRSAVRRGAVVHTCTRAVADELRDWLPEAEVKVVPAGVPEFSGLVEGSGSPAGFPESGAPYVLAVGTAIARKAFPLLISAFGAMAGNVPDLELRIAGSPGPASQAMVEARERLPIGVRRRVHLMGRVSDAHKHRLLVGSSALVHPSTYEGFGFPVLEAMASGVPVIAADDPAVAEVAGDAALLVPRGDEAALSEAITQVVESGDLAARLVAAGRERVGRFTWDSTAVGLMDLYSEVAQRS